jgi:putative resolvase
MILVNTTSSSPPGGRAVLYAPVCDQDQRADLDRHVARLTEWAAVQGLAVAEVVSEVGVGGRRLRFNRLLADPTVAVIVVEHRDLPARYRAMRAVICAKQARDPVSGTGS